MSDNCESPLSGEVCAPNGAMIIRWIDADCGKCPPCSKRRVSRLWRELSEARADFDRIAGELGAMGINTTPLL